jgi:TRAP transporter TAXI family solute receptor
MKKREMKGFSMMALLVLFLLSTFAYGNAATRDWPKSLSFPSGRIGTSVYAIVVGMSDLITRYVGIKTVPEAGSPGKNVILLHKKGAEFALGDTNVAYLSARGLEDYKKYGKMDIRLLFTNSVPTPFAFLTRRDANIRSVTDLKGKKVMCIYTPNPTFTAGANMLFEAVGMTKADVTAISYSGHQEGDAALKEKRIAAYIHVQTVTSVIPFIQELNNEVPIRIVGVPEEKLNAVLPKYPYFGKATVPAKIYGDLTDNKDMVGAGLVDVMLCRGNLPDDLVYEVMKAIFNHVEELLPVHPVVKVWVENPLAMTAVLPYHSGAIKYYKEKKLCTEALENKQKQLLAELGIPK